MNIFFLVQIRINLFIDIRKIEEKIIKKKNTFCEVKSRFDTIEIFRASRFLKKIYHFELLNSVKIKIYKFDNRLVDRKQSSFDQKCL